MKTKHAISFQRGRDALLVLLKGLGIGEGDEVILQAYTCIVVPNAIQYTGAIPIYADIEEEGFNIDPVSVEKLISPRTKAIIVQHTFGEPADIKAIQELCRKHKILLVEDCAHALSATHHNRSVGTFGDAAIWSFGRDKVISSVWGGMITTDDDQLAKRLRDHQRQLPFPNFFQIKQALLHPLFFALIKPIYRFKIGKLFLVTLQKIHALPRVIFPAEKSGNKPKFFPQRLPNTLAVLAHHQLKKLNSFHQHRLQMAAYYTEQLKDQAGLKLPDSVNNSSASWLRYTIRTPKAAQILNKARKQGIYLGDWYTTVLAPAGCQLSHFNYQSGSCPRAEKAAAETINLPTHIQMTKQQVDEVVGFLGNE